MARSDPRNHTEYRRAQHMPGLTLMRADFTTHEFAPHSHDALVVAATEDGGSEVRSRGKIQQATSQTLFAFNPAEPHAGRMAGSACWRYRSFYLTQSALDAVASGLGIAQVPYFLQNCFVDRGLIAAFLRLHRALEEDADAFLQEELLIGSFGRLFERYGSRPNRIPRGRNDRRTLKRAIDLMHERFDQQLPLDDLSRAVGLTKFQLIGLFNRGVGLTPHAYLTQIRLRAACRALKRGAALGTTAAAAGFYDQSAMTRHFKRAYGITPLQYASAGGDT